MSVTARSKRAVYLFVRWLARLLSAALLGLIALITIGEGLPAFGAISGRERAAFVAFGVVTLGLALGWFRELTGGALVVAGMLVFCGIEVATSGRPPGGAIPLLFIPGVLYLIAATLHGRRSRANPARSGWWRAGAR